MIVIENLYFHAILIQYYLVRLLSMRNYFTWKLIWIQKRQFSRLIILKIELELWVKLNLEEDNKTIFYINFHDFEHGTRSLCYFILLNFWTHKQTNGNRNDLMTKTIVLTTRRQLPKSKRNEKKKISLLDRCYFHGNGTWNWQF